MYKTLAFVLFIAVVSSAFPQESEYEPQRSDRIARATCDLLSASVKGVTLNHAACAAHCLVLGKGFKGGRCRDGICHCRK